MSPSRISNIAGRKGARSAWLRPQLSLCGSRSDICRRPRRHLTTSPPPDDGLTALVDVDVLHRDLLLAFAAVAYWALLERDDDEGRGSAIGGERVSGNRIEEMAV